MVAVVSAEECVWVVQVLSDTARYSMVWLVMVAPLEWGACHVTVICLSPGVSSGWSGASGAGC